MIIKIGVLVENKGKLLLIKELNDHNGKYYWNIIKGTFESEKDRDFLETAKRECKEEAGISVKIKYLQSIMYIHKKNTLQFNFGASIDKGIPKISKFSDQKKRKENIIEVKFFNKKELRIMKEKDFMNKRAFLATKNWVNGKRNDLGILNFRG
ncbi:MAG: NUDIX hydrolase [Candidatus Wolfebacteria bacterium]|nr:NUDIX hydrolase [Candidatus Wolfebacteria bacterium]